jgi:histidinol-phosphate phosphatase family protein
MISKRAVFLDLNGTLVLPLVPERLDELTPIEGVAHAIAHLSSNGYICPVVTVQSRIAKGVFTEAAFRNWFRKFAATMQRQGAILEGPYLCPHRFNSTCDCQKPKPFLYEQAAVEHGIDLRSSFVIGDTRADVLAAKNFGGQGILVRTGWPTDDDALNEIQRDAVLIAEALSEAAAWIVQR